ncbi:hypothetical protein [Roseospira visakhapatnamensis]|uniref:Uncharacterized protein n=1 Tax=Roseospira visakhapatnamensis TaxID=390880 RepID=A0A7W6WBN6_9PROT|nr:hypothetical protein [Roseospira visakhapatnamensis]MBB4267711.1 hypothetical protein [Roseospira visakhapatnamensis]
MIDLNHGSGATCDTDPRRFNIVSDQVNGAVDLMLTQRQRAQVPRTYIGASSIGRTCLRQIQYDYMAVPKDEGRDFEPRTLRIFEAGHKGEDIVAAWLKDAGFDLRTHGADGRQYGYVQLGGRFKGHIDGVVLRAPISMAVPALWENKVLGSASWQATVKKGVVRSKPIYAAQMAIYQAYMDLPNPALFTALNRDTWELYAELVPADPPLAQQMSDRAVHIVRACDHQEVLPRAAGDRRAKVCAGGHDDDHWHPPCAWQDRCWSRPS